ncbi:endonuclease/exonuclease/phosphatase family protein [Oceanisphaera sp. W20_SRM_FM3]|uniref:endonuclease/exonuclease/phosphatase family protein n=1 Tax=Oceanisphaera sp. W20_SRM_FM3 TaxID=3240267 RepID=UPI003F95C2B6
MMQPLKIRLATFNVALDRSRPGQLAAELAAGSSQARHLAHILQRIRPDILLLNEFDHDGESACDAHLTQFCQDYVAVGEQGIDYPHRYLVPTNTGALAPLVLNREELNREFLNPDKASLHGEISPCLPQDGLGFGAFHGQYAMAVLSRFPLLFEQMRSFRHFLWRDMPDAKLPQTEQGSYYRKPVLDILPLSSKNHLDLPVLLPNARVLHLLASHPAPPIDEGLERRNSCRNHDELRLWHDYIRPEQSGYLYDDAGKKGGLATGSDFVILGDLNADPLDGDGYQSAIQRLLQEPLLNRAVALGELRPAARGGFALKLRQPRQGSPKYWTHNQGLRLDYVLPSVGLNAVASGVYWPAPSNVDAELFWNTRGWPKRRASSDHRIVWVDLEL